MDFFKVEGRKNERLAVMWRLDRVGSVLVEKRWRNSCEVEGGGRSKKRWI